MYKSSIECHSSKKHKELCGGTNDSSLSIIYIDTSENKIHVFTQYESHHIA